MSTCDFTLFMYLLKTTININIKGILVRISYQMLKDYVFVLLCHHELHSNKDINLCIERNTKQNNKYNDIYHTSVSHNVQG